MDDKIEVSESALANLANSISMLNDGLQNFIRIYTLKEDARNKQIEKLEHRIAKIEKWLVEATVDMTVVN